MLGGFVAQGVAAVMGLLLARTVGLAGYGHYAAALALAGAFTRFFLIGLDGIVPREIARTPGEAAPIVAGAVLPALAWGALLTALIVALGTLLGYSAPTMEVLLIVAPLTALRALLVLLRSVFRGGGRLDLDATNQVGEAVLVLVGALVAIQIAPGVRSAVIGMLAAEIVALIWAAVAVRRAAPGAYRPRAARARALLLAAIPLGTTFALLEFNLRLEALLLATFHPEREVGLYSAALGVTMLFSSIGFLSTALLPRMATLSRDDGAAFHAFWAQGCRYVLSLGAATGVTTAALAPTLIDLFYGHQFAGAAPALRLLSVMLVVLFVNRYLWNVLIALDQQAAIARAVGLALAVTLALGLLLIPTLGIVGAALTAIAREAAQLVALSVLARRAVPIAPLWRAFCGTSVAVVALGLFYILAGAGHVELVLAPLGLLLYLGALLGTRTIHLDELRLVVSSFRRA